MKRIILGFLILFILNLCNFSLLYGISINVSPNPAYINQIVNINITTELRAYQAAPSCYLEINYGDSQEWHEVGLCSITPCILSTNHSYNTTGLYNITVRSVNQKCITPPFPPDPVSTQITVQCPGALLDITSPPILPDGISGQAYSYQLQSTGGQGSIIYNLIGGLLPAGVFLSTSGLISGVPTTPGDYVFIVQVTDGCQVVRKEFNLKIKCPELLITSPSILPFGTIGQFYSYQIQTTGGYPPLMFSLYNGVLPQGLNINQSGLISGTPLVYGNYTFNINVIDSCPLGPQNVQSTFYLEIKQLPQPPISVTVLPVPSIINISRGQSSSQSISYKFKSSSSTDIKLTSSKGIFLIENEIIDTIERNLTVNIRDGNGFVSENILIPVRVIERAIKRNSAIIIYRRNFESSNLEVNADVNIRLTTEAGADFDIKRIELYFENKRAEITIERNYPELKAYADIRFVGSGLLQGYWEVDGRILSYVNQHLTYGRSITLETPSVPPLPTFDTGTHIVRFVISTPKVEIPLPSIVYFVTPAEYIAKRLAVKLLSPLNKEFVEYTDVKFNWEELVGIDVYVVEFYDKTSIKPIFSAYVKEPNYKIPDLVLKKIFSKGKSYLWKIKGFNNESNFVGDSEIWEFMFRE